MMRFTGATPFGSVARSAPTDPDQPKVIWRKPPSGNMEEDKHPRQDPSPLFQFFQANEDPKSAFISKAPQEPSRELNDSEEQSEKEKMAEMRNKEKENLDELSKEAEKKKIKEEEKKEADKKKKTKQEEKKEVEKKKKQERDDS